MGFTVIIVGGSVSGLSLANMLETFDINYILLEGHDAIAPQLGASIGLLPTGLRILDQLGCYETVRELAGKVDYKARMRLFSGKHWFDKNPVSFSERLEDRCVRETSCGLRRGIAALGTRKRADIFCILAESAILRYSSIESRSFRFCLTS